MTRNSKCNFPFNSMIMKIYYDIFDWICRLIHKLSHSPKHFHPKENPMEKRCQNWRPQAYQTPNNIFPSNWGKNAVSKQFISRPQVTWNKLELQSVRKITIPKSLSKQQIATPSKFLYANLSQAQLDNCLGFWSSRSLILCEVCERLDISYTLINNLMVVPGNLW